MVEIAFNLKKKNIYFFSVGALGSRIKLVFLEKNFFFRFFISFLIFFFISNPRVYIVHTPIFAIQPGILFYFYFYFYFNNYVSVFEF